MAHERKKHGMRKDKKNERMREDVAERKASSKKQPHKSDQKDIQSYKPGGPTDRTSHPKK
jgi:hypothetical protein